MIVSNNPNVVNYDITDEMVKHVKYHSFDDWSTIPWNSAYFDIDQPDLKLVSGYFYDYFHPDYQYFLNYVSDVAGVLQKHVDFTSHLIFDDEKAIAEIYKIKNRGHNKPLPILVGSWEQAKLVGIISEDLQRFLTTNFKEGKVTVIVAKQPMLNTPYWITKSSVAFSS
ncbi:Sua5/YciO/YrdC/YwlC family protein [Spiroplasma endosymbiont of Nebria brevicollis]|uniref:Sua5/YciO/YrdC/YwlC family protein n=1 Tax=Spiroplasma endosymbiont of Nebria brevicollis TaxID=3066284 RepID=UPI00313B5CCB